MDKKIYVTLANGKVFEGYSFGAEKEVVGELVFTTGIDYLGAVVDPCYYGQIVTQTFPLIGNYGVIGEDVEGKKCQLSAYIVREKCDAPSNFRCTGTLEDFLKEQGIPAVYGVDTRQLTSIVREAGTMGAAITFTPFTDIAALKKYKITDAVKSVASQEVATYGEKGDCRVVVYDFGDKEKIVEELVARGCEVACVPATYSAKQALAFNPDGVVLSAGPGDPAENTQAIEAVKSLAGKKPMFGIGLGHQIFALATGAKVRKMKYGHRGANQPVRELANGKVFISNQNHGYEVVLNSVTAGKVSYLNVNDGTCEGIDYPFLNAFTVQFHPDVCGGVHDANKLYDKFVEAMKRGK